jgi:hypothetical protein
MFCGLLCAEGIAAFVAHEHHIGNNWPWSTALGWTKVQVLPEQLDEAHSVGRLVRGGEFHALLQAEFGELGDTHCPVCGKTDYSNRRPVLPTIIAILSTFLLGVLIPAWGWVCSCRNCGAKFRTNAD